jgi:CRP-like cAMP-binding protein
MKDREFMRNHIERFTKIDDADWQLLEPHLETIELSKGQFFAEQGRREKWVAFVCEGDFRQFYELEGEEKTTYFYFEGHLMSAYFSCITGMPSRLSIEALTDARILRFSYSTLLELFSQSHNWEKFGRLLAEYLAMGLEERMVDLLTLSPEKRYQQLLQSNKRKILERIPQQYIASYLGITPVSLSRIRNRIR